MPRFQESETYPAKRMWKMEYEETTTRSVRHLAILKLLAD
jgi:hypothetical protein